jgi:hypothetical protein
MTPKEKAEDLVDKFIQYVPAEEEFELDYAKQCALIAVDEILDANPSLIKYNDIELDDIYWQEVKQEIEKL